MWWFIYASKRVDINELANRTFIPEGVNFYLVAPEGLDFSDSSLINEVKDITEEIRYAPHELGKFVLRVNEAKGKVILVPSSIMLSIREMMLCELCQRVGTPVIIKTI